MMTYEKQDMPLFFLGGVDMTDNKRSGRQCGWVGHPKSTGDQSCS